MIESMQKEIDKRFLKGIAASPGIVIGKPLRFVWSTARWSARTAMKRFGNGSAICNREILSLSRYRGRGGYCN